jgi:hypothetical protein
MRTKVRQNGIEIRIGIDPGKNGGIFFYSEITKNYIFKPIPLIGKEFDIQALSQIFTNIISENVYAVIEDVHSIFGASAGATFDFGFGCGLLEGILVSHGIPYTKVQPKKWQAEMFEGIPLQQKPSSTGKTVQKDTKKMAEMAAKRLFPNIDLRMTEKCKKSHDGKVDALLICEYCKRNF